jgi:hypothetical protein
LANRYGNRAATATLKRQAGVQRVFSEPTSDSEGIEALRITIVLKRGSADRISGDKAPDTLVGIEQALREAGDRVLPFDTDAARHHAALAIAARNAGRGFPTPDGYIAAIAVSRGFTIASRDPSPYEAGGLRVVDPWQS